MCGIAGIINCQESLHGEEILNAMCGALRHRGPDGYGSFCAPGVFIGHRRLAVNGEIYNYRELRRELESKGHTFATASDSEVILHLYQEYGNDFLPRLDGMFAFALYDIPRKKILLGRDIMGKKPLYYFFRGEQLVFCQRTGFIEISSGISRCL